MDPDHPLVRLVTHPALSLVLTFATAAIAAFVVRRWPSDRTFWETVLAWPGQAVFSVSLLTGLAGAFPRLVWEPGRFRCDAAGCWTEGGGQQVVDGTGFGPFLGQTLLGLVTDLPAEGLGVLVGWAVARLALGSRPGAAGQREN